jgi:hypothetical protein
VSDEHDPTEAGAAGESSAVPVSSRDPMPADEAIAAVDLATVADLPTAELRTLRHACEEAEEAVSYARRLLQGRLDILRAELLRREHEPESVALLSALTDVLAADHVPSDPMKARATRLRVPPGSDPYMERLDAIADEARLAATAERDLVDLRDIASRFADEERALSARRRQLFDRIDALRDELAARYKDGRADVSELLGGR